MAKNKKTDDEVLNEEIAKESNPDHFRPQVERTGPLERPKAVHPSHEFPQEESRAGQPVRPQAVDPKHLKPQE